MQMQFSKNKIGYLMCAVQEVKNAEVTQEIRLPDDMPDIGRVLISWGQVMLRSKQWQGGMLDLSGGVKTWVLYAPEDGTEPRVTECWMPFQLRWDLREAEREGPVRMMPRLRFVDSRGISARKMLVRAGVGVLAQGFISMEQEMPALEEIPEDMQLLKKTYTVRMPVDAGEKTFEMDETLEPVSAGSSGGKIISYTLNPEVSEKRVLSDKVVFKGYTNLHVVIRDGEGKIQTRNFELPFSQFAELDSTYGSDAQADVKLAVTDLEADMNENGQVHVKCGMVAQYLIDDCRNLELAEDAYSPIREVSFETKKLDIVPVLEERTEIIKAEQNIQISNGQLAEAQFYPDYPRIYRTVDGVNLEVSGVFQLLTYGDEGAAYSGTAKWEGNLAFPADAEIQVLTMIHSDGQIRALSGIEGVECSCSMQIQIRITGGHDLEMITSMELGELQKENQNRPSVILCRSGGKSLWTIAKENRSTVHAICRANGIEGEPGDNQMLLIPVV